MPSAIPHFVILGSPRSGTTLVQRLCCELEGVVVPYETHFFSTFVPRCRPRFPLEGACLLATIRSYLALPTSQGLGISTDQISDRLGGHCADAASLFAAILGALTAERKPAVVGEKTPGHLRHWRELLTVNPELKLIGVVRDPRAVVASRLHTPWKSVDPRTLALAWRGDQATLRTASAALGPGRFLCLRYEDVVRDYDAERAEVAGFLGVPVAEGGAVPQEALFHEWEHWKARAVLPPEPARADAWRTELDPGDAAVVARLAGSDLLAFGYEPGPKLGLAAWLALQAWHGRRRLTSALHWGVRLARGRRDLSRLERTASPW